MTEDTYDAKRINFKDVNIFALFLQEIKTFSMPKAETIAEVTKKVVREYMKGSLQHDEIVD